jgi:membrane protease YdiL (CAAX protease family)
MHPNEFFVNVSGHLRSAWRLVIFVVVYVCILFLLTTLARLLYAFALNAVPERIGRDYLQNVVFRLILLIAALAAGYICTRGLEKLPWRALGLWFHSGWLRDFGFGSLLGFLSLALATAIATAAGGLTFTISGRTALNAVFQTLLFSGVLFIIAALAEEALFRGYPLQTLARANFAGLGVLLTSVPFAAVHLQNPNVVAGFTFINTALAGVWFAFAYLKTRSLWFPLGIHWAWNWALGSVFGLPVSGISDLAPHPLMKGADHGPAWLTGGNYGIEGGVACTIALIISTIFIYRTSLVKIAPEVKKLTPKASIAEPIGPDPELSV